MEERKRRVEGQSREQAKDCSSAPVEETRSEGSPTLQSTHHVLRSRVPVSRVALWPIRPHSGSSAASQDRSPPGAPPLACRSRIAAGGLPSRPPGQARLRRLGSPGIQAETHFAQCNRAGGPRRPRSRSTGDSDRPGAGQCRGESGSRPMALSWGWQSCPSGQSSWGALGL